MSNVLVTGGTGQIGRFLCDELLVNGHKVVCLDSKPDVEGASRISTSDNVGDKKISVVVGDVTELGEIVDVVRQNSIDRVIHLAASLVFDSMQHPAKAYKTNIIGTNNVLEAARMLNLEKVIFASSVAVYGHAKTRRPGVADEEDIPDVPSDPYSTTKMTNELMGRFYRETYGLDVLCLRITAAWGPGRYWGYTGQFNDFVRKVAIGEHAHFPPDFSYRGERLKWMYVKDVGRCFASAVSGPKSRGYLYNTGSKTSFNARDVLNTLKSVLLGSTIEFEELDEPTKVSANISGANGLDIDCSRLYDELGFEERYTLTSAVEDMIAFERERIRPSVS